MMQKNLIPTIASIGEEIGFELGAAFIEKYKQAHPADVHSYRIGREIIEKILNQPGCVGIEFFNAIDENGQETLVYIGLDENGKTILQWTNVNSDGSLLTNKGIVADRIDKGGGGYDSGDWTWDVD